MSIAIIIMTTAITTMITAIVTIIMTTTMNIATPMEELVALMKYMVGHNASHAKELADLAAQLDKLGNRIAYEQVMAAVSDFEKGNMRLSVVLSSLEV